MVTFEYSATDLKTGELHKAEVQADSQGAAAKLLIAQGLFPISIEDKNKGNALTSAPFFNHVRSRELVIFTRQLSTLVNAGLPLVQSLRSVQGQIASQQLKQAVTDVIASVEGGSTLSQALSRHPTIFNQVYIYLVAAGETSGTLDKVLERLADQQEKDAAILRKVRNAMIYPIIVLVVVVAVVTFLLVTLLPQVKLMYQGLHRNLPLITRMLVGVSDFVIHFWWLTLIAIGGGIYGLVHYVKTDQGRHAYDQLKLSVPIFGVLFRKVYMARFARTMSTLLASGIPMLEAMDVTRRAIRNTVVEDAVMRAADKVKGGKSLSSTLEVEPSFIPLVPQMIAIGEQAGAMDDMLLKVATFYEEDVDNAVKTLATTIEPVMMVVLGVIVGGVIAAVLLPIYGLVSGSSSGLGG